MGRHDRSVFAKSPYQTSERKNTLKALLEPGVRPISVTGSVSHRSTANGSWIGPHSHRVNSTLRAPVLCACFYANTQANSIPGSRHPVRMCIVLEARGRRPAVLEHRPDARPQSPMGEVTMAGSHSTERTARTTGPITEHSSANASKELSNVRVTDVSSRNCPASTISRGSERRARAPTAPPRWHDGPEVARSLSELVAKLRSSVQLGGRKRRIGHGSLPPTGTPSRAASGCQAWRYSSCFPARSGSTRGSCSTGILKRMHYGYGAPPVFQPAVRELATECEREFEKLMSAVRGKRSEAAGPLPAGLNA